MENWVLAIGFPIKSDVIFVKKLSKMTTNNLGLQYLKVNVNGQMDLLILMM
jgi:hypothetical protein